MNDNAEVWLNPLYINFFNQFFGTGSVKKSVKTGFRDQFLVQNLFFIFSDNLEHKKVMLKLIYFEKMIDHYEHFIK